MKTKEITIIGGGLAGSEAAWQAARRGCKVKLHEMRPVKFSPAHESPFLAELVCSNSLRSNDPHSAVGLLKEEMRRLDSLIIKTADQTKVPAGKALAVDREKFARQITEQLEAHDLIEIIRQEVMEIPEPIPGRFIILASGPLTAEAMSRSLSAFTGQEHLAFYDAIAPIIETDSLDRNIVFQASRYDEGPGDYLNCPMDEEQYRNFISELKNAAKVPLKDFEEARYFEGCLPIEVMLDRGDETLRFGPLKPVGLPDPRTGKITHAVVQLRKENEAGTHYNMVGFQTKLTYPEQKRIFRMIPGLEKAEFSRLGSIHRNTFVKGPEVLLPTLQCKKRADLLLAGQITGVEGYVESTAMGLLAGLNATRLAGEEEPLIPPPTTALGALIKHLTDTEVKKFQPSNINFGLFPGLGRKIPKKLRGEEYAKRAMQELEDWRTKMEISKTERQ